MNSNLNIAALTANQNMGARGYWKNRAANFSPKGYFADGRKGAADGAIHYDSYKTSIPAYLSAQLNSLAGTPKGQHVVLLSILGILAQKYSGHRDVCILTTPYGDNNYEVAVPVCMNNPCSDNLRQLLPTVSQQIVQDMSYSDYPLAKMLGIGEQELEKWQMTGLLVQGVQPLGFGQIQPSLLFLFEGVHLTISYDRHLYSNIFIGQLATNYFRLLGGLLKDTSRSIAEVSIFNYEEETEILLESARDVNLAQVPASFHQERLWFIDQFETGYLYPGTPVYHNMSLQVALRGVINQALLKESIAAVVAQHPILRTCVENTAGSLYQVVKEVKELPYEVYPTNDAATIDQLLNAAVEKSFTPFDLPFRISLIVHGEDKATMVLVLRHIIADRFTLSAVAKIILTTYAAYLENKVLHAPEPSRIQYSGLSVWQKTNLQRIRPALLSYWRRQLDSIQPLVLPLDRPRAAIHVYQTAVVPMTLPLALHERMMAYIRAHGIETGSFLLTVFKLLLHKYSGQEEIVIGTPLDYRDRLPVKDVLGPVSNLVVLKDVIDPAASFAECLQSITATLKAAVLHGLMPFDQLVEELAPEKDMARTALFDVLFRYEAQAPEVWNLSGIQAVTNDGNTGYGKYDLNLLLHAVEGGTTGMMVYNALYFDESTIQQFVQHFYRLADRFLSAPEQQVATVSLLDDTARQQLFDSLDNTAAAYPDTNIVDVFAGIVKQHPNKIAIRFGSEALTYAQLDERSGRVAAGLRNKGVKPGVIVGLLMERHVELIVSMMSILKAGGAYLPIDPDYPEGRIAFLLKDSRTEYVLTSKRVSAVIETGGHVLLLEDLEADPANVAWYASDIQPDALSYIIYTSGTTGNPKGVMIEHRHVIRLFFAEGFQFDFGPDDVWTLFHSHCFDFSVWEIFGALLFGGTLVIIPKMIARDTKLYRQIVRAEGVTVLNQTPTAFYNFIFEELLYPEAQLKLRYVIFGGEKLSPWKLKEWHARYPDTQLINMYGITETTVHVTFKKLALADLDNTISNIGKPIPTLSILILDKYLQPVPAGVAGEMYVGGAGLGRGYLHNNKLTEERFIAHPFVKGKRLYKTGDEARLLPNGEIEYHGRLDHQVQLRGFRVELGEIEVALEHYPAISKAVVIAMGTDSDMQLVAYYVAGEAVKDTILRTHLSSRLPDYMLPSNFVFLDKLPLTANGKLDKKALPAPSFKVAALFQAPESNTEKQLAQIWASILHMPLDEVSTNASFFESGGHSLRAMMLVNQIQTTFHVSLPLKEIFERKDIYNLAKLIDEADVQVIAPMEKAPSLPYYPLSPAQKAIYFFHEFDQGSQGYNMPRVVKLQGRVDRLRVEFVFNTMVQQHEGFRTTFEVIDGIPVQRIHEHVPFAVAYLQLNEEEVVDAIHRSLQRFDLQQSPLLRVLLIEVNPEEFYLLVDSHHIVMDGTSWGILTQQFRDLYVGSTLPPVQFQYRDYVQWQLSEARQQQMKKHRQFWEALFEIPPAPLDLVTDFARPEVKDNRAGDLTFALNQEEVMALKQLAEGENVTLFTVLLSIFTVLLHKISGKEDIVIGTPIAGRGRSELQSMIGMFVNVLPLRNEIDKKATYSDWIKAVKSRVLSSFDNQDFEYEWLAGSGKFQREANRSVLYDVMFIYQNFEEANLDIPGISVQPFQASEKVAEFDMSLTVYEGDAGIQLSFGYQQSLFKAETIARYARYFRRILTTVTKDTATTIEDINLLSGEELHKVTAGFNDTAAAWPSDETIVSLFVKCVSAHPGATCLVFRDNRYTYADVDELSNRLCHYLQHKYGVKKGDIVALFSEHSDLAIIAILAILKTGAAYLPLDPASPESRVVTIIQDAGVKTMVSLSRSFIIPDINHFILDEQLVTLPVFEGPFIAPPIQASDLAYVIYTSGSTGVPKGVLQQHQTILNLSNWQYVQDNSSLPRRSTQFAPYAFDVSVQEIFYALLNGHTLYVVPVDIRYVPAAMATFVADHEIQFAYLSTAYLEPFCAAAIELAPGRLSHLERIMVAGEALKITTAIRKFFQREKVLLENEYGPTEAHLTTSLTLSGDATDWPFLPTIGKPIFNTHVYIIDEAGHLLPVGIPGELCIQGVGVARGYLNRPDLTAEKFVPAPYGEGVMYRTGDIAAWLPDGNVEFKGRRDDQIKIRGFRIELAEVEEVLRAYPGVEQAAVIVREKHGQKMLIAYYRSVDVIPVVDIRTFATSRLPTYMVPATFIQLSEFPLNHNGKLNKKLLPDLPAAQDIIPAPCEGPVEKALAEVWATVLGVDVKTIGATSSFFELGGHSLNAIHLINKIYGQFNVKITLKDLFARPDIKHLASLIDVHKWMDVVSTDESNSHELLI